MRYGDVVALILALTAAVSTVGDEVVEGPTWIERTLDALAVHLEHHPDAEAADVYKLLHQAVMGPGHAIPDRERAARWLDEELAGLGPPAPNEPLCEPLGGEPAMVRIHLRPFLAAGGSRDRLLEAFVATANDVHPAPARFAGLVRSAVVALADVSRTDLADGLARLAGDLEPSEFPALHHSDAFEAGYRPAYRVVALDRARRERWCD